MKSFREYYEESLSLNPKTWVDFLKSKFFNYKTDLQYKKEVEKKARENILKITNFLKTEKNVTIKYGKDDYYDQDKRLLSLKKRQKTPEYKPNNLASSNKNLQLLFTMAHETGHVLQLDNPSLGLNDLTEEVFYLEELTEEQKAILIKKIWQELHAWVEGLQFIPSEFVEDYKRYAFYAYKTYMKNKCPTYYKEPTLTELLNSLNYSNVYDEYTNTPSTYEKALQKMLEFLTKVID